VTVARNSDCAFNTVLGPPHSAGRPCMDHGRTRLAWRSRRARALATELTELATELTMAERRSTSAPRRTSRSRRCSAPPFQDRHLEDAGAAAGTQQQHAYSRHPTAAAPTLQQQAPVDLYYSLRQSHATRHCCLNCCSPRPTSTSSCPSTTSRRVTQRWSTFDQVRDEARASAGCRVLKVWK